MAAPRMSTESLVLAVRVALLSAVGSGLAPALSAAASPVPSISGRWFAARSSQVAIEENGRDGPQVTEGMPTLKLACGGPGSRLAFFRLVHDAPREDGWRTKISVVGADGRGLRELTSGDHADFNPTWMRDGSPRVIFNRFAPRGWGTNDVYVTRADGAPGDEVIVSDPGRFEFAESALRDGRIFLTRIERDPGTRELVMRAFLLTPKPGGAGLYEELERPTTRFWHKLSVSPSEKKIAYLLDLGERESYYDAVVQIADLDVTGRVVSTPVSITEARPTCIHEYPRWSPDEQYVVYDSNCSGKFQIYAYRISDGTTHRISPDPGLNYRYACFDGVPP